MKKFGYALIAVLVIIQFFGIEKNVTTTPAEQDISKLYTVPADVAAILKTSCNDCHSNNTIYPWYSKIQPVAWWLQHHVNEGKHELNFNEFASYSIRRQYRKLEEVIEQVKENEMPLGSYTLIHKDAKLTDQQKATLTNWAQSIRDSIKAKYPADSLVKKH